MSTAYPTIKAKSDTHQIDIHWHTGRRQYVATLYKRTGYYINSAETLQYLRSVFADSVDEARRLLDAGDMEIVTDGN